MVPTYTTTLSPWREHVVMCTVYYVSGVCAVCIVVRTSLLPDAACMCICLCMYLTRGGLSGDYYPMQKVALCVCCMYVYYVASLISALQVT